MPGPVRGGYGVCSGHRSFPLPRDPGGTTRYYLLLTAQHGWTADRYQAWLAGSLQLLLLPE
jgi:hypothetical protein